METRTINIAIESAIENCIGDQLRAELGASLDCAEHLVELGVFKDAAIWNRSQDVDLFLMIWARVKDRLSDKVGGENWFDHHLPEAERHGEKVAGLEDHRK